MTLAQDLAERAASNGEPSRGATVADLIKRQMPAIERSLPTNTNPTRFAQIVLTECKRNPQLMTCDPMSLLGAMMTAAQLGLQPGPLGHCYLIPRKGQVQFQLGYKGMIDLALRGGQVLSVDAHVVYAGDSFEYRYGTEPFLDHTPNLDAPGEKRCVYAVARLKAGGVVFRVLSLGEVARRRARGFGDSPAWRDDEDAMTMKTAVRALSPFIPQTPEFAEAQRLDDTVRTEITPLEDVPDPARVENEAERDGATVGTTVVPDGVPLSVADTADPTVAPPPSEVRDRAARYVADCPDNWRQAWIQFKGKTGLRSNPEHWTDAQCESVCAWFETEDEPT